VQDVQLAELRSELERKNGQLLTAADTEHELAEELAVCVVLFFWSIPSSPRVSLHLCLTRVCNTHNRK
jgi:hypothetical protein